MDDKQKELLELAKPLIKWLNENYDPHVQITITQEGVELSRGIMYSPCYDFLKD